METKWGDHEAMTRLIHQMGQREGFGGMLSDGWQKANRKFFGNKAADFERYIPTIKGMTVDQDTRGTKAMALGAGHGYPGRGLSPPEPLYHGGDGPPAGSNQEDHRTCRYSRPRLLRGEGLSGHLDRKTLRRGGCPGVCRFVTKWMSPGLLGFNELAESVSAVTGYEYTPEQLMEAGERIYNLEKLSSSGREWGRKDVVFGNVFISLSKYGFQKGSNIDETNSRHC